MIQVLIHGKEGQVWDVSSVISGMNWKTSRIGRAGSLELSLIKGGIYQDSAFTIQNGDVVKVAMGKQPVFYGYLFTISGGPGEEVKLTAYDQMRYLMNEDGYSFEGVTAGEILQRIAEDFGLKLGKVADTGYKIPRLREDSAKLIDIICKAITLTFASTGRDYCLYDHYGSLTLQNVDESEINLIIGDGSLMYDYQVQTSIDSATYNQIKLYRDNKDTNRREIFMAKDSVNIERWGLLQLFESVDENKNKAQIEEQLRVLATIHNRETRSLQVSALGDIRIRAGMRVRIRIAEYGVDQALLVDQCTHRFEGTDHTMELELRVV